MLFILIQVNLVFTRVPFSEIAKHKHHIPCHQLQDAKDYLDMIQHKDELLEDSKVLGSFIGTSSEFSRKDLTVQDLEGIGKLLEYYDSTDDLDKRDEILQDLYNQIVTMKGALDYDLEQIDDSEYDRISDLVNQAQCEDVQIVESFQPLFKQEEPKQQSERTRERIKLANNSKVIKLPRRRKHAKKKFVITRLPSEWDKDAIHYDEIPIPDYNDYQMDMGGNDIDCEVE